MLIRFLYKYRTIIIFLMLMGLGLFMTFTHKYYHSSQFINSTNTWIGGAYEFVAVSKNYFNLKLHNRFLAEENAKLRSQLKSSYTENTPSSFNTGRVPSIQKYKYIDARVIYNSYRKRNNYVVIDKGSIHGIKKDMGVLVDQGVIGVVQEVSENYSLVMSILNSDLPLNVRLKKNDFFGSMTWEGDNYKKMLLLDIPKQSSVQVGDTIITDGKSFIFPEKVPIGVVSTFSIPPQENYYQIEVELFIDFRNLNYVYVVENTMQEELYTLTKDYIQNE